MFQDNAGDERSDEGGPRRRLRGDELQVGERVRHDKFGDGWVRNVNGSDDKAEVVVDFDKSGCKTLTLEWAPLQKVLPEELWVGDCVRHDDFGVGEVRGSGGSEKEISMIIEFDAYGPKELPLLERFRLDVINNEGAGDSDSEAAGGRALGAVKFIGDLRRGMWRAGDQVRHDLFGPGTVRSVRGTDIQAEVMIDFDKEGLKTLLLAFLPLEKLRQGSSGPADTG